MIRINLAPLEELENKHWYVPDALACVGAALLTVFLVQTYIGQIDTEVEHTQREINEIETNTLRLQPEIKKFANLQEQVESLKEKLASLEKITVSKIERYKPVILLEHLQTIKPEGLWFSSLIMDSGADVIHLVGGAFDNLLVAEFMSSLGSTRLQEFDPTDMRSQIFFRVIHLERVASAARTAQADVQPDNRAPGSLGNTSLLTDPTLKSQRGESRARDSHQYFTETSRYPVFQISVKHAERRSTMPPVPNE